MAHVVTLQDNEMIVLDAKREAYQAADRRHALSFVEYMAAALAAIPLPRRPLQVGPGQRRLRRGRFGKTYTPNGDRECARRARQIAKGSLRRENGLWKEGA